MTKFVQLWTLFGHNCLSPWSHTGFDVTAPALPAVTETAHPVEAVPIDWQALTFQCSFGTANVQSLYRGPDGHQEQMRFFKLNIMAIQEARSEEAMAQNDNILRISSGCHNSHYGVELWVDLDLPYAYTQSSQTKHRFRKDHFQVAHRDPRRLLLRCDTGTLILWSRASQLTADFPENNEKHGGTTLECFFQRMWTLWTLWPCLMPMLPLEIKMTLQFSALAFPLLPKPNCFGLP